MNTFSPLQYFITLSVICGDAPPVNVSGHPSCCSEHFLVHPRVCCVPRVLCERIPREVNADCRHQRIYGLLRERAHLYCTSEPPNMPCRLRDRRYAAGKDAKRTKRRHCATPMPHDTVHPEPKGASHTSLTPHLDHISVGDPMRHRYLTLPTITGIG